MSSESEGLADIGGATPSKNNYSSASTSTSSSWRQLLEVSSNRTRKIRGSNYVQIATIDDNNNIDADDDDGSIGHPEPRCRTVVFRGFLKNIPTDHRLSSSSSENLPCIMKMITDQRSQKVTQLSSTATSKEDDVVTNAEMVWWFPKTSEQYRIRGNLFVVGAAKGTSGSRDDDDDDKFLQTARREQWGNLSDSAREAFYDPRLPGQPYNADSAADVMAKIPAGGRDAETGQVLQPPPDCFLLMLLQPNYCDYLRLGGTEQYRQIDERQGDGSWTSVRVNP